MRAQEHKADRQHQRCVSSHPERNEASPQLLSNATIHEQLERSLASLRTTGFTFVELMASITILILLTTVALPLARVQIQRTKEVELKRDLREMREAIDHYKDFADRGMIPVKADTFGYPPDLKTLVEGVELKGSITAKYKFLRKLPVDPMTESDDWGMRSMQDDTDSRSWGGQNVFDVYSKSDGIGLDGTKYSDW
jgi:general secretion pathway protein G